MNPFSRRQCNENLGGGVRRTLHKPRLSAWRPHPLWTEVKDGEGGRTINGLEPVKPLKLKRGQFK